MTSTTPTTPTTRVFVWDVAVRAGHWLLAAAFMGAFLTAESERLRLLHVRLGLVVVGIALFRIAWGFVGTRYARFAAFVTGPAAVLRYLKAVFSPHPEQHVGHNPASAAAILGMLALGLTTGATGWMVYEEVGPAWLGELHGASACAMLTLVVLHVAGVALASIRHRENLIGAMVTGWKAAPPDRA